MSFFADYGAEDRARDLAKLHIAHGLALDRREAAESVLKRIATASNTNISELKGFAKSYLDNNGISYG